MRKLQIQKFVDGKLDANINIPAFLFGALNSIIPKFIKANLNERGLNLQDIALAQKNKTAYTTSFDVIEHGIYKTIKIDLI